MFAINCLLLSVLSGLITIPIFYSKKYPLRLTFVFFSSAVLEIKEEEDEKEIKEEDDEESETKTKKKKKKGKAKKSEVSKPKKAKSSKSEDIPRTKHDKIQFLRDAIIGYLMAEQSDPSVLVSWCFHCFLCTDLTAAHSHIQ